VQTVGKNISQELQQLLMSFEKNVPTDQK